MSILGEIPLTEGQVLMKSATEVSYAEQEPLIVTGTIQENILFGQPMDDEMYQKVCQACCLDSELAQMPAGDQTQLGEMGTNLSGGQKARISLARALYRKNSNIILIDSSLSALDTRV